MRRRGTAVATVGGETIRLEWDAATEAVRAFAGEGARRRELAVVPMYWFALDRHFDAIRSLAAGESGRGQSQPRLRRRRISDRPAASRSPAA
ncbi:MAG TPA: hypothetical protein VLE54_00620, partial [Thermoanaerobaculia bacterium]|nr:hypothetical protein [Thermoanaerobaculia bacterium]